MNVSNVKVNLFFRRKSSQNFWLRKLIDGKWLFIDFSLLLNVSHQREKKSLAVGFEKMSFKLNRWSSRVQLKGLPWKWDCSKICYELFYLVPYTSYSSYEFYWKRCLDTLYFSLDEGGQRLHFSPSCPRLESRFGSPKSFTIPLLWRRCHQRFWLPASTGSTCIELVEIRLLL